MKIINQKNADRNAPILDRIESLRIERGMSKEEVYKMMNVSPVSATHWRSGKNRISDNRVNLAAEGFGVDPVWLLTGIETKKAATPEGDGESGDVILRFLRSLPKERVRGILLALDAPEEVLAALDREERQ